MFEERGICLKNYEVESLVKSFLLFFLLIASIYLLFMWQNYTTKQHALDIHILQEMKIFTYEPLSKRFGVDFVPPDANETLLILHNELNEVYGVFRVPTMDDYLMKVTLPMGQYEDRLDVIRMDVIRGAVFYLILIFAISLLLAYYSLHPIRQALRLNKEFMKDILHDVNTPIASIAVNLKLLQKRYGKSTSIDRITNNIETIGMLRENLHAYLGDRVEEEQMFDLGEMLAQRLGYFRTLYPHLTFRHQINQEIRIRSRHHACIRILDNLIGNAAKYNKQDGSVVLRIEGTRLVIADTGRGIKNVDQVFRRHYKEGDRGMGLGLHIVYKLCRKLHISIEIKSRVNEGTEVYLDCSSVIQK
jgi:signal transduction histidine kinase